MASDSTILNSNLAQGGNIAPNAFIAKGAKVEYPINLMHSVTVYGSVSLGKFTYINVNSVIYPRVEIGRYCSIARNCEIGVANHPIHYLSSHPFQFDKTIFKNNQHYQEINKVNWNPHLETVIGNDVWIGAKVIINSGLKIGHGSIIAAGSVVTKNIPPYAIVGGIPARVIKYRFSEETIQELLVLKWWELGMDDLKSITFDSIETAIKEIKRIRGN